jgi:ubiquinone/menaquinone biosynthesis C-methylase UbiE
MTTSHITGFLLFTYIACISSKLATTLLEGAFKIKPLFKLASTMARKQIIKQGLSIGVDWDKETKEIYKQMDSLNDLYSKLSSTSLKYPEYYMKPFHAYDEGNLSWQAAVEVESAALTVHAPIYTSDRSILDINGDAMLRDNFHTNMKGMLNEKQCRPIKNVLDIGCSTGLSTLKLHTSFPNAEIIGCDLSPYMLSVGELRLESDIGAKSRILYIHAAGEDTKLPDASIDLVSISLVSHELPESVSKGVFMEAYRLLRPGGAISFMDVDPDSASFTRLASNPFAFQAFRSTEPWIQEYIGMDLFKLLETCGFKKLSAQSNSPRHRTVVGIKTI